ncbi:MAG: restriction endonuclease subunit S, partial [Rickettsiales bacterium]|nr:restriction endonuclease subunit S [Rickettsiales bacterium]
NKLKYISNGTIPHISRQRDANGICGYVGEYMKDKLNAGRCLSIDMFCNVFWRKEDYFLACDHVLTIRHNNLSNENIGLFLKSILEKQRVYYGYNKIVSEMSLKKQKITLPITLIGQPDWAYMDHYIANLRQNMKLEAALGERGGVI